MNLKKFILPLLGVAAILPSKADEGMWLLPLLEKQNVEMMKQRGLELEIKDIYNPDSIRSEGRRVGEGGRIGWK